jgi:hypothetical protein
MHVCRCCYGTVNWSIIWVIPQLRWSSPVFFTRRPGFNAVWLQVTFMVPKVSLKQVFLRVLRLPLDSHNSKNAPHSSVTCDCPHQAAYHRTFGLKLLWPSSLTRYLVGLGVKTV